MESLDILNQRLIDHFSVDIVSGQPIYRIVWSEDQFEKRLTKYSEAGLELLVPEVRELPKYKQWIRNKYILERLSIIPENSVKATELGTNVMSYEPLFVFEDGAGNPLPPNWNAAKYVIDEVQARLAGNKSQFARYIDDENNSPEAKEQRMQELEQELFGNETETTDALAYKQGIVVPSNYKVN